MRDYSGVYAMSMVISNGNIIVHAAFLMRNKLKAIPGRRWNAAAKAWVYPATGEAARALREIMPVSDDVAALAARRDVVMSVMAGGQAGVAMPDGINTKPFGHQRTVTAAMVAGDAAYANHDMGTGKTFSTILAAEIVNPTRMLIACPVAVVPAWASQWRQHVKHTKRIIAPLTGPITKRTAHLKSLIGSGMPFVAITNYEGVWRESLGKLVLNTDWDMVVCDEIHRIKDPRGKASKFFADLRSKAHRRIGLTGTAMPNNPLDLFGQMRFIDPALFGDNYYAFVARYGIKGGFEGKQVLAYKNLDEMHAKFYTVAHRVMKRDVLDLPPVTHQVVEVDLGAKAMAIYSEIEGSFVARVELGEITVDNALVELLRLQQITGGCVKTDDGIEHEVDTSKADALAELLGDLPNDEPMVVFCRFTHDIQAVKATCEKLGRTCAELSGHANELAQWQDGEFTDIAVQIQAGGVGVDLTRAAYCTYYSLGFSLGDYEQSLARLDRQGQTRPVNYYHLIANGTVDQRVYGALKAKTKVVESVLKEVSNHEYCNGRNYAARQTA
jgi:SNF2 family DNA or RNA helicase